jgi:hypothetical protein
MKCGVAIIIGTCSTQQQKEATLTQIKLQPARGRAREAELQRNHAEQREREANMKQATLKRKEEQEKNCPPIVGT